MWKGNTILNRKQKTIEAHQHDSVNNRVSRQGLKNNYNYYVSKSRGKDG